MIFNWRELQVLGVASSERQIRGGWDQVFELMGAHAGKNCFTSGCALAIITIRFKERCSASVEI